MIFLDLDHFKLVNDSMGHTAGDELLQAVAQRLRATLRPGDTVARFGGDEFVVLCEEIADEAAALEVADRLSEALAPSVDLAEGEVFVTASQGVALSGGTSDSASGLLRDADTAMYMAKERGRSRTELFDVQRHAMAHRADAYPQPAPQGLRAGRVPGLLPTHRGPPERTPGRRRGTLALAASAARSAASRRLLVDGRGERAHRPHRRLGAR